MYILWGIRPYAIHIRMHLYLKILKKKKNHEFNFEITKNIFLKCRGISLFFNIQYFMFEKRTN